MFLQFLMTSVYLRRSKDTKDALQRMELNIFKGVWQYTQVGIPVTIMVWFDRWSLYILTAMAAFIGVD